MAACRAAGRRLDNLMGISSKRWMTEFPEVEEIHLWAGFPCVDLSSVNPLGAGLQGKQSSLFYEVPRIRKELEDNKPAHVHLRYAV